MTSKTKILFLINTFSVGGAELHLLSVVKNIDLTKFDVTVGFFREDASSARSLVSDFNNINSIRVIDFGIKSFFSIRAIYSLYKFIKDEDFDVVQTLLFRADLLGIIFSKICRVNFVIASIHDNSLFAHHRNKWLFWVAEKAMNYIYSLSDCVIVISKSIRKTVVSKYPMINKEKIALVYYGATELPRSNPNNNVRKILGYSDSDFVVGAIGRIDQNKGHIILINAIKLLRDKGVPVKLFIAGHDDYNLSSLLKDYVLANNLGSIVTFLGYRRDVSDLFSAMDVFAMPSLNEGLGLVVIEAMLAGKAIVASNSGALPELITADVNGLLFECANPNSLSDELFKIYRSPRLSSQFGAAARELAIKSFSESAMIKSLEHIYRQ